MIWRLRFFLMMVAMATVLLAGCDTDDAEESSKLSRSEREATLNAFAPQSMTATPPEVSTATPPPTVSDELALLVANMINAVLSGNNQAYLQLIWKDDPLFVSEQTVWAEDWKANPPSSFTIELNQVYFWNETLATARMTILWRYPEATGRRRLGTTLSVQFKREDAESPWLFAGEYWQTLTLRQQGSDWSVIMDANDPQANEGIERIRLYYFNRYGPTDGTDDSARKMAEYLPGMFTEITEELGFIPQDTIHIKLYTTDAELGVLNSISFNYDINVHVAPNQALKISQQFSENDQLPPDEATTMNALTHAIYYQMDTNDDYAWWFVEGVARLIRSKNHMNLVVINTWITDVAERYEQIDEPTRWSDYATLGLIPVSELVNASQQSFSMLYYIEATYGTDQRRAWVKAIAEGQTIEAATTAVFGISFGELDANWRTWLQGYL